MLEIPLGPVQLTAKFRIRLGWVVDGHINIDLAKDAFEAVVNRWRVLGARIQADRKPFPWRDVNWYLVIPPEFSPSLPAFNFTHSTSSEPLSTIYPFDSSSHFSCKIYVEPPFSLFSPSSYSSSPFPPPPSAPLLNLHIGHYPGLTAVGITTSHAVFDAVSIGLVLREWEMAIQDIDAYKAKGVDKSELGELCFRPWLAESVKLDPGWLPNGWYILSWPDRWSLLAKAATMYIEDRFLGSFESRYMMVPKPFFENMKKQAHLELLQRYPNDSHLIISTADIVGAWIWQNSLPDISDSSVPTSFVNIISARGILNYTKIPCFNSWGFLSTPAIPIREARTLSVAELGRRIRCVLQEQRTPEMMSKLFKFLETRTQWALPFQKGNQEMVVVSNAIKGALSMVDLRSAMETGSGQVLHKSFTHDYRSNYRNCFTVEESPDNLAFLIIGHSRKSAWERMKLSVESATCDI